VRRVFFLNFHTLLQVIFGSDFPTRPKEELAGLTDANIDGSFLSLVLLVLTGLQKMLEAAFLFDALPLKVVHYGLQAGLQIRIQLFHRNFF
jgi:hypothetical protein